ncbi:MAG: tRNA pseudouridine(55) synthase TruB [Pseudomonadales bacterium]
MSKPRKARGRRVDGILLLDKPIGMSSNAALQRVKWLFSAAKAGHTGSLDPMATGVLPLCFGEATKFSQHLLDADKAYRCTMRLGIRTTTADAEGEELSNQPAPSLTRADVDAVLPDFIGQQEQVPPMYSALKHQGTPLYKLAREGVEVERAARAITIYSLVLLDFRAGDYPEVDIEVHVSKGTYIRTLAEDIGEKLGCGAHVSALRRIKAGQFEEAACVTLEQLVTLCGDEGRADAGQLDHYLLPVAAALDHLQTVTLPASMGYYLRQGQPVLDANALRTVEVGEIVRLMLDNGEFLGVAEILADGRIAPRRLLQ